MRYVLTHDAVAVTIPGAKNAAQVEGNVAACDKGPLPKDVLDRVMALVEPWGPDAVQCT